MTDNGWSADANAATRLALTNEIPGATELKLHCKHTAGRFGHIVIQSNGTIEVVERDGGTNTFPTIEAFIQAGWTLD